MEKVNINSKLKTNTDDEEGRAGDGGDAENCIFIHSCILKETFVSQRFLSLSLSFSLAQLAHKHVAL